MSAVNITVIALPWVPSRSHVAVKVAAHHLKNKSVPPTAVLSEISAYWRKKFVQQEETTLIIIREVAQVSEV